MFTSTINGSVPDIACCPAGKHWIGGDKNCTDCAVGKYNDQESQTVCKNCDAGKYNDETASASESACKNCSVGKYNDQSGRALSLIHI